MFIKTVFQGVVIGVANVIPGLSGGTMAVLLGIYSRLIGVISSFTKMDIKTIKKEIFFILFLGLGWLIGVILFSYVLSFLLKNYAEPTSFFFMGVVLVSLPYLFTHDQTKPQFSWSSISSFFVFFFVALSVFIIEFIGLKESIVSKDISLLWLFFSGVVGAAAMIVPGISGSLLLLIMGAYTTVIEAIKYFDLPILLVFGVAVLCGLGLASRLIQYCLNHFKQASLFALSGLILGSVPSLYVGFTATNYVANGITFLVGFGIVPLLSKINSR
jgi:putative membrane protein